MHLALYSVRRRVTIHLAPHTPSTYSSTYSGKLAYNHFIHALLTDLDRRSFTSVYNYANATSLQVYLGPFTAATSPPGTRVRHAVNAGVGYTISDSIMKNHLLFRANPRLRRRVLAVPNLKYHNMKVDALMGLLSSVWASMVEEGVATTRTVPPAAPSASTAAPTRPSLPPLTEAERDKLREQKGCFHCRRHPGSPDWTPHGSRNCPGDLARGIQPRYISAPTTSVVVGAVKLVDDNDNEEHTVYDSWGNDISLPAVFENPPMSCVLSEDDESDFSDKL